MFPKIKREKEIVKKNIDTTQPQHKVKPKNIKETSPVINKQVKIMANKPTSSRKGTKEYNMGYDIVEDIKKTKANISLF